MRLLVTGALGHIGSRFIHSLKPGDLDEVVLLDNLYSQRYASLFDLPDGVPIRFVSEDVCTGDLEKLLASPATFQFASKHPKCEHIPK